VSQSGKPATAVAGGRRARCLAVAIVMLGTALRLWLLPLPNNDDDLFLQDWARRVHEHGVVNSYNPELGRVAAMHPPLNYYLLGLSAAAYRACCQPAPGAFDETSVALMVLIKLPNLLCDLLIALVIVLVVRSRAGGSAATAALAFYMLNPAMIWEASFVGQIEAVQTLPILMALAFLYFDRVELSWAALALAVLTKPQGIVLAPLVLLYSILTWPPRRLLRAAGTAALVAVVILLPWLLEAGRLQEVVQVFANTVDTYPFLTVNGANLWGVLTALTHPGYAIGGGEGEDTLLLSDAGQPGWLPGLTYKQIGLMLFALAYVASLWALYRRRDKETLLLAAAFGFLAFFMLPTQVTERYLFPFFPILATVLTRATRRLYLAASVTFMANLYLVFPLTAVAPWGVISNAKDPLAHGYFELPTPLRPDLTLAISLVNVLILAFFLAHLVGHSGKPEPPEPRGLAFGQGVGSKRRGEAGGGV
jgi:4-amino-4-deoxy-L-arabinose transferase-like glycosyltransferase